MRLLDIKGVGKVTEQKLNQLGITTIQDFLSYLPTKYYDLSKVTLIKDAKIGEYVLIKGTLLNPVKLQYIRRNFQVIRNYIADESGVVEVEWFNQPYLNSRLKEKNEFYFFGKINQVKNKKKLINPSIDYPDNPKRYKGILPIYKTKNLINQSLFYSFIKNALEEKTSESSVFDTKTELKLWDAFKLIHVPENLSEAKKGSERIMLEEIVKIFFAYSLISKEERNDSDFIFNKELLYEYLASLPFELTESQKIALEEIISAMQANTRMNRMLIGDVGSGKTIIAFIIALLTISGSKAQVVMMAPTEILANQHYNNAVKFLKTYINEDEITLLTSSSKNKKEIVKKINDGEIKFIIGTHAVLQDNIIFNNLKIIIIDEVHKFGVKQKAALERKMESVDTLIMSATPIPRAISLMFAGELQISTIERRNENLSNVKTVVIEEKNKNLLLQHLLKQVNAGEKIYLICPRIETAEGDEIDSIQSIYKELLKTGFTVKQIGYIHGKIKNDERNLLLDQFRQGEKNVIISTTVVEVGIDIQDVNIMVIFDANYFGLSTLHQLRGRIGRDGSGARCYLMSSDLENQRLEAMVKSNNGFELANIDAQLRGYGDFFGYNQSGGKISSFAINEDIIKQARRILDSLTDPEKEQLMKDEKIISYQEKMKDITFN